MYFRLLSFTWQRHFKIFDICINNTREQSRAAWQAKPSRAGPGWAGLVWQICIIAYSYVADLSCSPGIGQIKKRRHYAKYAEQLPAVELRGIR